MAKGEPSGSYPEGQCKVNSRSYCKVSQKVRSQPYLDTFQRAKTNSDYQPVFVQLSLLINLCK